MHEYFNNCKLKMVGEGFRTQPVGIAVPKGSPFKESLQNALLSQLDKRVIDSLYKVQNQTHCEAFFIRVNKIIWKHGSKPTVPLNASAVTHTETLEHHGEERVPDHRRHGRGDPDVIGRRLHHHRCRPRLCRHRFGLRSLEQQASASTSHKVNRSFFFFIRPPQPRRRKRRSIGQ